jgi:hypothetical protein
MKSIAIYTGKYLSDAVPISQGLKQDASALLLFTFASEYTIRKVKLGWD